MNWPAPVMTRALCVKEAGERPEANEGGREEEENGLRDCCSDAERFSDLNIRLYGVQGGSCLAGFYGCVS